MQMFNVQSKTCIAGSQFTGDRFPLPERLMNKTKEKTSEQSRVREGGWEYTEMQTIKPKLNLV